MGSTALQLVLLVAPAGIQRDSLVAFLKAIPACGPVVPHCEPAAAYAAAQRLKCGTLVVDASLPEAAVLDLTRRVRAELPDCNCVVLAESLSQQSMFQAAGVQHVLLKGRLGEGLRAAVLNQAAGL